MDTTLRAASLLFGSALLFAAGLFTACGEREPVAPSRPTSVEARRLPPVSGEEKARFALDRLLKGPLPRTAAFGIDKLHLLNMEHARADLVALRAETFQLLADPALRRRVADPESRDRNPWHNILEVIANAAPEDPALVEAWATPALEVVRDAPLHRRAVAALLAVKDRSLAPILLRFLATYPADRVLAPDVVGALSGWGSPWRERALAIACADGGPRVWARLPELVGGPTADLAEGAADALAWWALLAEGSGPRPARGSGRSVTPPWFAVRVLLDEQVWPDEALGVTAAISAGRVFAPESVMDAAGFLPGPAAATAVRPVDEFLTAGRGSSASARCQLAGAGFAPWVHAVTSDLHGLDPDLRMLAENCPAAMEPEALLADAMVAAETFVEQLEAGTTPSSVGVYPHLRALFQTDPDLGFALSWRILRAARPAEPYLQLLEAMHDLLLEQDEAAVVEAVSTMATSEDPLEVALALTLIRRGRRAAYAPAVSVRLADAHPSQVRPLRQLLVWLHTAPGAEEGASRAAFVDRYAAWLAETSDLEAASFAPGLLDLGSPGAAAYARGLAGDRRHVYVSGLLQRTALVPLEVSEALLAPVDESTSPQERQAVWVAAYRTAPAGAAGLLAAVRARLPEAMRGESDDVLEALRHRADR